jgi:hypothetical protein
LKTDLERHQPTEAEMRDASICYHVSQWEFYQFFEEKIGTKIQFIQAGHGQFNDAGGAPAIFFKESAILIKCIAVTKQCCQPIRVLRPPIH